MDYRTTLVEFGVTAINKDLAVQSCKVSFVDAQPIVMLVSNHRSKPNPVQEGFAVISEETFKRVIQVCISSNMDVGFEFSEYLAFPIPMLPICYSHGAISEEVFYNSFLRVPICEYSISELILIANEAVYNDIEMMERSRLW